MHGNSTRQEKNSKWEQKPLEDSGSCTSSAEVVVENKTDTGLPVKQQQYSPEGVEQMLKTMTLNMQVVEFISYKMLNPPAKKSKSSASKGFSTFSGTSTQGIIDSEGITGNREFLEILQQNIIESNQSSIKWGLIEKHFTTTREAVFLAIVAAQKYDLTEDLLKDAAKSEDKMFVDLKKLALHEAAKQNDSFMIKLLVNNGALLNVEDEKGKIALDYMKEKELKLLLESLTEDEKKSFRELIIERANAGKIRNLSLGLFDVADSETLKVVIEKDIRFAGDVFFRAVSYNNIKLVENFISAKIAIEMISKHHSQTPLHYLITNANDFSDKDKNDKNKMIEILLRYKPSLWDMKNADGLNPLELAVSLKKWLLAKILLDVAYSLNTAAPTETTTTSVTQVTVKLKKSFSRPDSKKIAETGDFDDFSARGADFYIKIPPCYQILLKAIDARQIE